MHAVAQSADRNSGRSDRGPTHPEGSAGAACPGLRSERNVVVEVVEGRRRGRLAGRGTTTAGGLAGVAATAAFEVAALTAAHATATPHAAAFARTRARFCVVSFDSDWLYPTELSHRLVHALNASAVPVSFVELSAPFGHDSFLLDVPALDRVIAGFLSR